MIVDCLREGEIDMSVRSQLKLVEVRMMLIGTRPGTIRDSRRLKHREQMHTDLLYIVLPKQTNARLKIMD